MKNGLVSFLLTGATYLRGKADNSKLQKEWYAIVFSCFIIYSHSKEPSQIYEGPPEKKKILKTWTQLI